MTFLIAIFIAILQGITELFPVSSLGHAVIIPKILGLPIDQHSKDFLPFLVVLHLGTATALLLYFYKDWINLFTGLLKENQRQESLFTIKLIIVATLPAVIFGFLLEHFIRHLFASALWASFFLILNGFLLFYGEKVRRKAEAQSPSLTLNDLTLRHALTIGLWQCSAFFPGISRSGATITAALLSGLSYKAAAHFSFLIATPIIFGASFLEIPKILHQGGQSSFDSATILMSGIISGITAYLSIVFLMKYFGKNTIEALKPFAYYCWFFGSLTFLILAFRF